MAKWFVLGPDGPIGPVTIDQLRRGLVAGKVPAESMVAPEGSPAWSPITEVLAEVARKERADVESILGAAPASTVPRPSASIAPRPPPRPSARAADPSPSGSVVPRPSQDTASRRSSRPPPAHTAASARSSASTPSLVPAQVPSARSSASTPSLVPAHVPSARSSASTGSSLPPVSPSRDSVKSVNQTAPTPRRVEADPVATLDTVTPPPVAVQLTSADVVEEAGPTASANIDVDVALETDRPRAARRSDLVVPPPLAAEREASPRPSPPDPSELPTPIFPPTGVASGDAPARAEQAQPAAQPPLLRSTLPSVRVGPSATSLETSVYTKGPLVFSVLTTVLVAAAAYRVWVPPRVNPSAVAADAVQVLELHEGAKRAAACENSLADREDLARGRPYVVEHTSVADICRVVSTGRPGTALHGGFVLTPAAECGRLETTLPRDLARHEASLNATIAATCGPNQTPTSAPDNSTKLAAQGALTLVLPQLIRDSAAGQLSPALRACYDDVVRNGAAAAREERRLRCAVLRGRAQGSLPPTTVLRRSGLVGAYEAYGREHAGALASLRTQEREGDFLESFLRHAETQACSEGGGAESNADTRLRLSSRALASCLGPASSLLERAPDGN
jgi:hypothetical protein